MLERDLVDHPRQYSDRHRWFNALTAGSVQEEIVGAVDLGIQREVLHAFGHFSTRCEWLAEPFREFEGLACLRLAAGPRRPDGVYIAMM